MYKGNSKISLSMDSLDDLRLSGPGPSLWSLISEHASESELQKIRAALSHHLVDKYIELHAEVETYHRMWQERKQIGNHGSRAETPLADPPAVKELVRAEIKMLLQNLKEKASRGGSRDGDELLLQYKPETVHYALSHQEIRYSSCGITDSVRSRPSSSCSIQSRAEDEIEAIRDKLKITEIHRVVAQLRSVLLAECDALTATIKHFKGMLNLNSEDETGNSEPSLTELRELRASLQMDLALLPSAYETSSALPIKGLKNSFRRSAEQRSTQLLSPLRPASPSLCNLKPKPPSPPPPAKASLSRPHSQHRIIKPPTFNRMDPAEHDPKISKSHVFATEQDCPRTCLNLHIDPERNTPSPDNHRSSHRSTHRPSTDLSPGMERKATPVSAPAFSHFCDAGSNDTGRSVLTKGKLKALNGQQNSNIGENSADDPEKSSVISQTSAEHGRKNHKSGTDEDKMSHFRIINKTQYSPKSHGLVDKMSYPPKRSELQSSDICFQPQSTGLTGIYVTLPGKPQRKLKDQPKYAQEKQNQFQFSNVFYQSVGPAARTQT
ncbi:coiled-coil domain-containing protein 24 isoform X1 [Nothobranchius furzeri]|uniref:LOC107383811-like protein n=1 Tax=Nothobranchius furzeri TaxID=105023 RepID=A0A8C6P6J7_NOTFU|nr:coiled-coil domain-containing protein 24 isoform X1 [Nothobranchius furzeri]KAF7222292.1 putative LOC107383811-like protein [Nothobranchius furzeri]